MTALTREVPNALAVVSRVVREVLHCREGICQTLEHFRGRGAVRLVDWTDPDGRTQCCRGYSYLPPRSPVEERGGAIGVTPCTGGEPFSW